MLVQPLRLEPGEQSGQLGVDNTIASNTDIYNQSPVSAFNLMYNFDLVMCDVDYGRGD